MKKLGFSLIAIAILIVNTGDAARQRIAIESDPDIYSEADIEQEILFGREMTAIILADNKLSPNLALNRYLTIVGQSVLRNAGRTELIYHFGVIESEHINAYAAPGGYILVTTKAISLMENEAELAGVLAHEIAHITERHIVKALNIRADKRSSTDVFARIISSSTDTATVVFEQAVGEAVDLLFSHGLEVMDEVEADRQGVVLAAQAGYSPDAYHQYLARIKPIIEKNEGQLSKTHPPFKERIRRLKKTIVAEGLDSLGSYVNRARFQQNQ